MAEESKRNGEQAWLDLTVEDAEAVRDFYGEVLGWASVGLSMGDYEDYVMTPPGGGAPVGGVCHARGANAELPAVWIPYFLVADLEAAAAACRARGGTLVSGPRSAGPDGRFAVARDPAGAVFAMFQRVEAAD